MLGKGTPVCSRCSEGMSSCCKFGQSRSFPRGKVVPRTQERYPSGAGDDQVQVAPCSKMVTWLHRWHATSVLEMPALF